MAHDDFRDEQPVRARIPADLDAPDRILAGLTVRQLLVLSLAGLPVLLAWQHLGQRAPWQFLLGLSVMVGALALSAVVGTRDGLSLDAWVLACLRYRIRRKYLNGREQWDADPAGADVFGPELEEVHPETVFLLPDPVHQVDERGVIVLDDGRCVALVGSTTLATILSTNAEDAVLADGSAQWLNSLSGPVQILLQSRPTDLTGTALDLAARAGDLPHPELARAALDHAEFLLDINEYEQPLRRRVLIACAGNTFTPFSVRNPLERLRALMPGRGDTHTARHAGPGTRATAAASSQALANASRTVEHLQALGARAKVLDAEEVLDVLDSVWDPFATAPFDDENAPQPPAADPGPARGFSAFGHLTDEEKFHRPEQGPGARPADVPDRPHQPGDLNGLEAPVHRHGPGDQHSTQLSAHQPHPGMAHHGRGSRR
ncbi:PrgI family protein [Kineosporia rhizophila]|uniref:PrgI family protein n=1 Tax=Kineosporia TaxID=49184 RepID=UPI001E4C99A5|nr:MULTISPECIES: PrgI family protein [Kineosporia]MCE0539855.1 PrgI family protein [Kineosporia rhizophila]GLY19764.1 hypothetical protein Kisp01_67780 [Kineosporia sp. NBRC 101677]